MSDTRDPSYAERLQRLEGARWKQILDVQAPYRWNLRRHHLGRTLDVGCGVGRNLRALQADSVGVDHNVEAVAMARSRGFQALTVDEWESSDLRQPAAFDSMLVAHVIEHLPAEDAPGLLKGYLPYVRPGGQVMLICPQEKGYTTDATHVTFTDQDALIGLCRAVGLEEARGYSFPLPRIAGKVFPYNEFCVLARVPV